MLNIIVLAKVVMDPEAPVSSFKIDPEAKRAIPSPGVPPVLNPYDENCLEAALRIKEQLPSKITIISMGENIPKAVVKKCLAVGADDLVILEDDAFANLYSDTTASILAQAIKKLGEYDLILAGRMAADSNAGQVGPGVAELLGIPSVSTARKVEVNDGRVRIERMVDDGYEVVETALPCLVTVSHELGELRSATIQGLMAAQKQPFTVWQAQDLATDVPAGFRTSMLKLFIPEKEVECEIMEGETAEEAGANLARRLRELKLI